MKSVDFYDILENKQNYKCYYTNWNLEPNYTSIAYKVRLKDGGRHSEENVILIHSSIAKLAREVSEDYLVELCEAVVSNRR